MKLNLPKKLLILSIALLMILISLAPIQSGELIEHFGLGGIETEIEYTLKLDEESDLALEATGYFTIPTHRGAIKEAYLNLQCEPDESGNYLIDPRLDVGLDGDYEWRFNEKGYGKAGNQDQFSTGLDKRLVVTARRGVDNYDNRSEILLPKDATINSASMKIKGGPGQYKQDLYVAISFSGYIYYIKSNGDGSFGGVTSYKDFTNGYTYGIGLGDFDGDNDLDIVYGEKYSTANNAEFFLLDNTNYNNYQDSHPWGNNPTPSKIGEIPVTGWNYVYDLAVEDFDNDGNLDFITNLRGGTLYLFRGRGDLTFHNPVTLSSSYPGTYALGKDAADFNNDGNFDFIAGGSNSGTIYYFEGKGDGTFKSPTSLNSGPGMYQYSVSTADFDDDFNADIVTKGYSWGTTNFNMQFIKGKGDGTFYEPVDTQISFPYYWYYGLADSFDFDYDGFQDMIVLDGSTFYFYEGDGAGDFYSGKSIGGATSSIYSVAAPPRMPLGGCENLSVNLGDDSTTNKVFSGNFNSEKSYTFTSELSSLISNPSNNLKVVTDSFGNEMYRIPIRFDSDTIGSVLLYDLDIKYDYTAKVKLLPGERYNLTTDLDDLIPADIDDTREVKIYFGMYSDTPGKVTLSNLHIEYNGGPKCTGINDVTVNEAAQLKAINLTKYFTDDYDISTDMTYGIQFNGDLDHIQLSVQDQWLYVDSTEEPDWFGSTEVKVWCKDTEGVMTISNQFKLTVKEVDDPPMVYNPIPNIELRENQTKTPIDLDDPIKDYFIDVDSTELYYRAALATPEEHSSQLSVSVVQTTNKLRVQSIGTFGRDIGVRIYCDDDISLLSMSVSELESLIDTYQTIVVNITSGTSTFPPQWLEIPLSPIDEDTPQVEILNLYDYVTDADDHWSNLTFSIHSLSYSGYIDLIIDDETGDLSIYPRDNFDGISKATLMVTDDEHNSDLTTLTIEIIQQNDQPIVEISEPTNGSAIRGLVDIIGSAYDPKGDLSKVEIAIGETGSWIPVDGLGYWTYKLDVNTITQSSNILLVKVRAEDSTGSQSLYDKVYLKIKRPKDDRDGDGYPDVTDKFPDNPSEWKDSDGDKNGDNSDAFSDDMTQWSDTDGDGYGDNPEGNNHDRFPFDNTQWLDTDGDGHGDNDWGNDGDFHKYDPERWEKDEKTAESKAGETEVLPLVLFMLLIFVAIITALVLINYGWKKYSMKK